MRRGTLLSITASVALVTLSASPPPANAQNPGRIFGVLTSPLRMMVPGFPRRIGPGVSRHRAAAQRSYSRRERAAERAAAIRRARAERAQSTGTTAAAAAAATAATAGITAAAVLWPSASASAYEEMLGYALWPNEYGERFWSHGVNDIMSAMMAPTGAFASKERKARVAGMCSAQASERAERLIARVAQTVQLTPAQRSSFEELRAAVKEAIEREKQSCQGLASATPAERIKALGDGLWSLRYAASFIRAPLEKFHDSLTDAQKAKLAGDSMTGTQACGQTPANAPDTVVELAKFLATSCPQGTPPSPVARLDVAGERLATMAYAAMSIDPAAQEGSQTQGKRPGH
jgi:hypothetical protein